MLVETFASPIGVLSTTNTKATYGENPSDLLPHTCSNNNKTPLQQRRFRFLIDQIVPDIFDHGTSPNS
jgi:hypothetical protein